MPPQLTLRTLHTRLSRTVLEDVEQIRVHQGPQGGAVPVLPDLRAERSHKVRSITSQPQPPSTAPEGPCWHSRCPITTLMCTCDIKPLIGFLFAQVFPHKSVPDHEEEQPVHPYHASRGCRHIPESLRQIRSVRLVI